jgi:hypothetical protein
LRADSPSGSEFLADERMVYWKYRADCEAYHDVVADLRGMGILTSWWTSLFILAHNFVGGDFEECHAFRKVWVFLRELEAFRKRPLTFRKKGLITQQLPRFRWAEVLL